MDSGATTSFINKSFVKSNNLVTTKLATAYQVRNADNTLNKAGRITHAVKAYIEIETHKHTQQLLVTDLGDKDVYIGYEFLYKHNSTINWAAGEWEFTRCPEICKPDKAVKTWCLESDIGYLEDLAQLELMGIWDSSLDEIGESDESNQYINWLDLDQPDEHIQAQVLDEQFDKSDVINDEDTS